MQLRTAGPRTPANDLELPQHPGLEQSPRQSLLQRAKAAKAAKAGAKVEGKEESFEKLKKVKSLKRLRSLKKPEVEQDGGNQAAMVVKSFAVKTGSGAGTSSTERPVTHHLSSTLEGFVGSVGDSYRGGPHMRSLISMTFRPQKWNLKAHMWYQLSP